MLLLTLVTTTITACGLTGGMKFALVAPESGAFDVEVLELNVEVRSCQISVLAPPALPKYAEAVSSAIASVPGADVMIDVTFEHEFADYWYWYRSCAIAKGSVGRLR